MAGVFTSRVTIVHERLESDQYALGGRTVAYKTGSAKLLGCDKLAVQTFTLSAGVSAQAVNIAPLGVSAPALMTFFTSDQPVDVRTNSPSDTVFLSGIQLMAFTGHVSSLFLSTGTAETQVHIEVNGGSNAVMQASFPLP